MGTIFWEKIKLRLMAAIMGVFIGFSIISAQAQVGGPPTIIIQPTGLSVQSGGSAMVAVVASSATSMTFKWYLNGQPVSSTNASIITILGLGLSTMTINNFSTANAGNYSVKVVNAVGSTTSSNAAVVVSTTVSNVVSFVSSGTGMTATGFKLQLSGPVGSNYVINASADLTNWTPISTNAATNGSVTYLDTNALSVSRRFYRVDVK